MVLKDGRGIAEIVISARNLTVPREVRRSLETVKLCRKSARLNRKLLVGQRSAAAGEAQFEVALERSGWGEGPCGNSTCRNRWNGVREWPF